MGDPFGGGEAGEKISKEDEERAEGQPENEEELELEDDQEGQEEHKESERQEGAAKGQEGPEKQEVTELGTALAEVDTGGHPLTLPEEAASLVLPPLLGGVADPVLPDLELQPFPLRGDRGT